MTSILMQITLLSSILLVISCSQCATQFYSCSYVLLQGVTVTSQSIAFQPGSLANSWNITSGSTREHTIRLQSYVQNSSVYTSLKPNTNYAITMKNNGEDCGISLSWAGKYIKHQSQVNPNFIYIYTNETQVLEFKATVTKSDGIDVFGTLAIGQVDFPKLYESCQACKLQNIRFNGNISSNLRGSYDITCAWNNEQKLVSSLFSLIVIIMAIM